MAPIASSRVAAIRGASHPLGGRYAARRVRLVHRGFALAGCTHGYCWASAPHLKVGSWSVSASSHFPLSSDCLRLHGFRDNVVTFRCAIGSGMSFEPPINLLIGKRF